MDDYTNWTEVRGSGGSLGACVALALFCRIIKYPHREDYKLGVSATIDLRGRLGHVEGLDEKAGQAHRGGLKLMVVASGDQQRLEKEQLPFDSMPEEGGVRTYAKNHFKGAKTMLDVIGTAFPGKCGKGIELWPVSCGVGVQD